MFTIIKLFGGILGAAVLYGWGASSTYTSITNQCDDLGMFAELRRPKLVKFCDDEAAKLQAAFAWPKTLLDEWTSD